MELVIMAAGMGSRFGGLKQIEPVGPNGEFIIDYSVYDAKRCGFDKIVFIIKEENYNVFKETIGARVEKHINVEYVFQSNDILSDDIKSKRVKPLGTAHAIYCAKEAVNGNFAIINADDFYGYDAFKVVSEFLKNNKDEFAVVAYDVKNTITNNGSVKRGVCESENGYITKIVESSISLDNNVYTASPLDGSKPFNVKEDQMVSMNLFGFTPKLFEFLDSELELFLKTKDLLKDEFLIPDVVCKEIELNNVKVKSLNTKAVWHGMTYKEDKKELMDEIELLIENGVYPSTLWK